MIVTARLAPCCQGNRDADPRVHPPAVGEERATLVGFLRWQRDTRHTTGTRTCCANESTGGSASRGAGQDRMSLRRKVHHAQAKKTAE